MTTFCSELEARLLQLGVQGDVAATIATYTEVYEDVLDATQAQWSLFGAVIDTLRLADDMFAIPELALPLEYFCEPPIEPLDDEGMLLGLPFSEFPEGTEALCAERGVIIALDGIWSADDYSEVDMLLVSTGESKPGEAGTEQLVLITRDEIITYEDPLAYLDALLARQ